MKRTIRIRGGVFRAGIVTTVLAAALATSPTASAHAILLESKPANDAVLESSPSSVTLRFNEPVETAFGSIRVYNGSASRVDSGSVSRPDRKSVAISVGKKLLDGTYTVTWRVVSADSHPVSGAFVFHVGEPGANAAGVAAQVLGSGTPESVKTLFAIDRFLRFALIMLAAGGLLMLATALVSAADSVRRVLAWAAAAVAGALVVVSGAGIVLQGADAGGFGLGSALDSGVISNVMDTRFGKIWLAQAIIAAVAAGLAVLLARTRSAAVGALAALAAGALVAMPALSGHANASGRLSTVTDIAHVAAAAAWAGGLAFVLAALLLAGTDRWPLASRAVPRFSLIATGAVAVLLVAGVTNGYLQVKEWRGLWDTTYGVLLLSKAALVLPVLALGAYNNRFAVPRLRDGIASAVERTRFLRAVGLELAIVVSVVGLTAVLVQEPPAKASVAPTGPYATTTDLGPISLNLVVDPAKVGANQVHLYLLAENGQPTEVDEATLEARLPSKGIGPLRLVANRAGPGHYVVTGTAFPIAGDWQLLVEARRGDFDLYDTRLSIPIRKD
jgi:copper transport protein